MWKIVKQPDKSYMKIKEGSREVASVLCFMSIASLVAY